MTKKDYILIAGVLNDVRELIIEGLLDRAYPTWCSVVMRMENVLKADNPNFAVDKFEDACYDNSKVRRG